MTSGISWPYLGVVPRLLGACLGHALGAFLGTWGRVVAMSRGSSLRLGQHVMASALTPLWLRMFSLGFRLTMTFLEYFPLAMTFA